MSIIAAFLAVVFGAHLDWHAWLAKGLAVRAEGIIYEVFEYLADGGAGFGQVPDDLSPILRLHESLRLRIKRRKIGLSLAVLIENAIRLELPCNDKKQESSEEANREEEETAVCFVKSPELLELFYLCS